MNKLENQNTEYKESWRDEYLKWICGFANAQGGILYYLAGFIEAWGRGYSKIHDCFAEANLSQPSFEQVRGGVMATIQREKFIEIQGLSAGKENTDNKNVAHDIDNTDLFQITNRQLIILQKLSKNSSLSIRALSQEMSQEMSQEITINERTIKRDIAELKKKGILQHEGSTKKGYWIVITKQEKK